MFLYQFNQFLRIKEVRTQETDQRELLRISKKQN